MFSVTDNDEGSGDGKKKGQKKAKKSNKSKASQRKSNKKSVKDKIGRIRKRDSNEYSDTIDKLISCLNLISRNRKLT